jgi:hypothetical protein
MASANVAQSLALFDANKQGISVEGQTTEGAIASSANKTKFVVAQLGMFAETVGCHIKEGHHDVLVLPWGYDWSWVTESGDPLQALIYGNPKEVAV